jgi:hypothetical protein
MSHASLSQTDPLYNSHDQIRVISGRRPPWAWFDKRIVTRYGRLLGPNGIAVYMALTVHADGELQTCFPSYQTIAKQIGVSRPTVLKAIKLLIVLHLVMKQAMQSPEGDPGPNLYTLLDLPSTPLDLSGVPSWATIDDLEDEASPPEDLPPPPEVSTGQGEVVNQVDHPSQSNLPPVVNDVYPNKSLFEQDVKNRTHGADLHVDGAQKPQKPQPTSYGHRGYQPLTSQDLAERKAMLRRQAAMLAQAEKRRAAHGPGTSPHRC